MMMARSTLVLVAILCYFSAICKGGVRQVVYNEDDLSGSCKSTCEKLPYFSDKLGCDQISKCRFNRKGWTRGFVRCDWCTCDCQTSNNPEVVVHESKKFFNEDDLWGTCKRTCSAPGLQKTNFLGCDEIRDCKLHRKGWLRWFVRCNYCECKCVMKGNPNNYRLENVKLNIDLVITDKAADSVVVGKATVENHSSREQTFTRTFWTTVETSRLWEETSSSTVTSGTSVSISEPVLNIASIERSTTRSETSEYKWGVTKAQKTTHRTTQEVDVGPHSSMEVSMVGSNYISSVPYTADLVIEYDYGKKERKSISGILHEATISNVHLVYGKSTPLPTKRGINLMNKS